jgi:hypothetical protein
LERITDSALTIVFSIDGIGLIGSVEQLCISQLPRLGQTVLTKVAFNACKIQILFDFTCPQALSLPPRCQPEFKTISLINVMPVHLATSSTLQSRDVGWWHEKELKDDWCNVDMKQIVEA